MTTESEVWASAEYDYIARNSDGSWWNFEGEPSPMVVRWLFAGRQKLIREVPAAWKDCDWRDFLRTRPGKENAVKDTATESDPARSLAVKDYLEKVTTYNAASSAFTKSCKDLREVLGCNQRFVTSVAGAYYLVTTNQDGDFNVDPIESL